MTLTELLEMGDPTLRSWFLVRSVWMPFVASALYVFFVKRLGPVLMRNRKPFDLRHLMIAYNFSVVAVYSYCLCKLIYYTLAAGCYKQLCSLTVVIKGTCSYECCTVGWMLYALKYIEFADTVFFVLRKKFHLITNLHVVHHAALPVICWFMMRTEKSGFQFIPGGINAFIHIIMYTYYGLSAMGPKVQKILWWKEYLTLIQMTQFVIILILMLVVAPLSGCKTSIQGIYIVIFFATLFLLLFYNFYSKTYKKQLYGAGYSKSNGVNGDKHVNGSHKNENCQHTNELIHKDRLHLLASLD